MPAVMTLAFRQKVATWIKSRPAFLAWGTGLVGWGTTPPAVTNTATDLVAEIGRRKVTSTAYVVPDNAGEIVLRNGSRWTINVGPTHYLLFSVTFDPSEAPGQTIREFGLFLDGTVNPALPGGQVYFTPDQVVLKGDLAFVQREVFVRQDLTEEVYQFVLTC